MGDKATLVKARQELEDLYLGIRDNSADLSFKDLASFQQNEVAERKKIMMNMELIREEPNEHVKQMTKLGNSSSLDFSKAWQASKGNHQRSDESEEMKGGNSSRDSFKRNKGLRVMVQNNPSQFYDDVSTFSTALPQEENGRRRRPGIPHSNICALCTEYIYIFRHRCLVCGRVYCRQCVGIGMGEMPEGRKCIECLGRRFSYRYINKAAQPGCCCWRYPSSVKQQELRWAEKGPRRSGERQQGRSTVSSISQSPVTTPGSISRSYVSRARSPMAPETPTKSQISNSFVMSSKFSPGPQSPHAFPL